MEIGLEFETVQIMRGKHWALVTDDGIVNAGFIHLF